MHVVFPTPLAKLLKLQLSLNLFLIFPLMIIYPITGSTPQPN